MPFKIDKTDGKGQWQVSIDGKTYVVSSPSEPTEQIVRETLSKNDSGNIQRAEPTIDPNTSTVQSLINGAKNFGDNSLRAAKNPNNWSTIGGIVGGAGAAALTGGMSIPASIAIGAGSAATGGAIGETANESYKGENLDPSKIATEGAVQGAWDLVPNAVSSIVKRIGGGVYGRGMGITKAIQQNNPSALQEGLQGGRLSAPVITGAGIDRVHNRNVERGRSLIANSPATMTVDEIANRARPGLIKTASGSDIPTEEKQMTEDILQQFLNDPQRSNIFPPKPPQNATLNNGVYTPAQPAQAGYRVPMHLDMGESNALKQGTAGRSSSLMKGTNAGKFPSNLEGRVTQGISNSTKTGIEELIPGIKEANRRTQGSMGAREGFNPSNRSPEDLMQMGMDPDIAHVTAGKIASPTTMQNRAMIDLAAALGGGVAGGPAGAAGMAVAAHAVTSPMGQRAVGAGLHTAGRLLPGTVRTIRGAMLSPEQQALLTALNGQ